MLEMALDPMKARDNNFFVASRTAACSMQGGGCFSEKPATDRSHEKLEPAVLRPSDSFALRGATAAATNAGRRSRVAWRRRSLGRRSGAAFRV